MKTHFHWSLRLLHWLMALAVLAMLFIGAGMVSSVSARHLWLVDLHKPLGVAILVLAVLRLSLRLATGAPPLPGELPKAAQLAAKVSHLLLYGLLLALPLVGWAMLSAGGYPVSLGGGWQLPPLLAQSDHWYALLRPAHRWLAYGLLVLILGHMAAALVHRLVRRDGVLASMTWQRRPSR
ncbi:cytochrome b [Microbulbifer hainanensis]|uniref:cytochrome b n=1 Tax=Microbulbifer hainanensis TaxID=2735675 RepID=UPI00186661D5|nr:cytochrome b [Microbulbifer hainanensis]